VPRPECAAETLYIASCNRVYCCVQETLIGADRNLSDRLQNAFAVQEGTLLRALSGEMMVNEESPNGVLVPTIRIKAQVASSPDGLSISRERVGY